ncbi:MAG: class I SAM-dependent methyltransferase [Chloroflexota bacterium]
MSRTAAIVGQGDGPNAAVGCQICGVGALASPEPLGNRWSIRVCRLCESATTWPVPTDEELYDTNANNYPLDATLATYRTRRAEFRGRWDQLLEFLGKPLRILDVGCSVGVFLEHALNRGATRAAGIELNEQLREWGATHLGLDIRESIQDFRGEVFDAITLQDCLEHMRNPSDVLSGLGEILAPHGLVFIQLPNRLSDMARIAGTAWPWFSVPDHLIHLSPEGVRRLAARSGYEVLRMRTCDAKVDLIETRFPRLWRYARVLRRVPGFHRLWIRRGQQGGLIQAILVRRLPS